MKFFVTLTALALAASTAVAQQFMVNTPSNAVVCQPLQINWVGGTGPYFPSILPGSQPSAPALLSFGQVSSNSITWIVNITAGTSIGIDVRDSTGTLVQSAPFTIQSGNDISCLSGSASNGASTAGNTSPASSGAASASSPTPLSTTPTAASGGSNPTTANTPAPTNTRPATTSAGSSSAADASNSSTTSNAAPTQVANFGAAALLGAVAVAILG